MTFKNIYAMTDSAICQEIGQRLDQIRLEANIPQEEIARELGMTVKTYRNLIQGKGKFENIVGALRALGQLELVDNFIPSSPFSPLEMLRLEGKKRQRASRPKGVTKQIADKDIGW